MVAQVEAGETDVDYFAMRMAFAESSAYSPYNVDPTQRRGRMFEALFGESDYERALVLADSTLDEYYIDIDGHMIASIAHANLGDEAAAAFHREIGLGLARSILDSGEGTTDTSPFIVINTSEEYALLRVMGMDSRGQSLVQCNDVPCDRMEVEDGDTGDTTVFFFDVSRPFAWMRAQTEGE